MKNNTVIAESIKQFLTNRNPLCGRFVEYNTVGKKVNPDVLAGISLTMSSEYDEFRHHETLLTLRVIGSSYDIQPTRPYWMLNVYTGDKQYRSVSVPVNLVRLLEDVISKLKENKGKIPILELRYLKGEREEEVKEFSVNRITKHITDIELVGMYEPDDIYVDSLMFTTLSLDGKDVKNSEASSHDELFSTSTTDNINN